MDHRAKMDPSLKHIFGDAANEQAPTEDMRNATSSAISFIASNSASARLTRRSLRQSIHTQRNQLSIRICWRQRLR